MAGPSPQQTHLNPVYPGYFADPFVWKHQGIYYAIGTGELEAIGRTTGNIFPLLRSRNFFCWEFVTHALIPPDPVLGNTFWAPEIAYANDTFHLYYSVGHADKAHRLRVALSKQPLGPYRDVGHDLVAPGSCPFAIDPHPFRDDDGQWYFFYARDFLDCSSNVRAGTALVAARLKNMTELECEGSVILRARSDWQRFQSARVMYGGVWDWHTLEGPCVCKHQGRYYCLYSGGRWENDTYGVDYGVAHRVLVPYSDAGNEAGPRVLRTIPGQLIGPGHNSVVVGPDARTDYLVYHAWNKEMTARRMCMDPLLWSVEGPRCAP